MYKTLDKPINELMRYYKYDTTPYLGQLGQTIRLYSSYFFFTALATYWKRESTRPARPVPDTICWMGDR